VVWDAQPLKAKQKPQRPPRKDPNEGNDGVNVRPPKQHDDDGPRNGGGDKIDNHDRDK